MEGNNAENEGSHKFKPSYQFTSTNKPLQHLKKTENRALTSFSNENRA